MSVTIWILRYSYSTSLYVYKNNLITIFFIETSFRVFASIYIYIYMIQSKVPWPVGGHHSEKILVTYLSGLDLCGRPYKLKIPSTFWICKLQNLISNGLANNCHRTPKNRSKTVILSVILKFKQLQNVNLIETCSCYRRSENWICKYLMSR